MPIRVTCTECGKTLKVKDELAGKKGKCPGCGAVIAIAASDEQATVACKNCGAPMTPSATLCVNCGTYVGTGRAAKVKVEKAPRTPRLARRLPRHVRIGLSVGLPVGIIAMVLAFLPEIRGTLAVLKAFGPDARGLIRGIREDNVEEVASRLDGKPALVEASESYTRLTLLNYAAEFGAVESAKLLLERGADADGDFRSGMPPLNPAAGEGHVEIVRLLLAHGANPDGWDLRGSGDTFTGYYIHHGDRYAPIRPPILFAVETGDPEVVRALLEGGACPDPWYHTEDRRALVQPLHVAAREGYTKIAGLLIDHDAWLAGKGGEEDLEPIEYAKRYGHDETVRVMEEATERQKERTARLTEELRARARR